MNEDQLSRKLAVILHADVVGSTSLVHRNETLAHHRIQAAFKHLSEFIISYNGSTRELRGDALLADFERASDAVSAALAFQASNKKLNTALDDDITPRLRIGISLGEVVIADDTITGAGVVLAQRIEQLSDPDGVCITGALHEAIPRHMPFELQSLGKKQLQGFDDLIEVYKTSLSPGGAIPPPEQPVEVAVSPNKTYLQTAGIIGVVIVIFLGLWIQPWTSEVGREIEETDVETKETFSIAVLPFDNMSDDPDQVYFSDGISEDIITDLSQLQNLSVIARNSSFTYRNTPATVQDIGKELGAKYLLEGSVRRAGNQIRITAQLIEAESGHHLWAERFDRELTEVFALQDEITEKIVSALSIQISGAEQKQLTRNKAYSFEAYELFLQGQISGASSTEEGVADAIQTYRKAISLDPTFARAYGALAVMLVREVNGGFSNSPAETMERSLEMARTAVLIDPDSPQAHWALGYVYMYRKQFDLAVEALERAVSLAPSYADGYALLALIKNNLGEAEDAVYLIKKAMELNPYYSWDYLYNLGRANYALGHFDESKQYLLQAMERNPAPRANRVFLIATLVQLGELEDAEWEVMQLETSDPQYSISHLSQVLPITDEALRDRLNNDLRTAGMAD